MSKKTATQLTVTIPEGAPAGSILAIPVNGKADNIKVRVPEGLGAGSTLVLTQMEGSDEWTQEVATNTNDEPQAQAQAQPMPVVPGAVVGLDLNRDGIPDLIVAGPDLDQDGIPDALQQPSAGGVTCAPQISSQEPLPQDPSLVPSGPVAFTVRLDTSAGVIDIIVRPDWAPHGARRFLELAASGDLDGLTFYRAVKGCLAQFGLPAKRQWQPLPDDPPTAVPFLLGAVCFAAVGKNSRKSTLFICIGDMSHCFGQSPWETPIGAVAEASLDVLDRIETIYGDIAECGGAGPNTSRINAEGDEYLSTNFPLLTRINSAAPLDWPPTTEPAAAVLEPSEAGLGSERTVPPEPCVSSAFQSAPCQEPSSVLSSASRPSGPNVASTNGSGPARMPSSAKQKGTPDSARGKPGTPIDVPVEVVPSVVRSSPRSNRGDLSARPARSGGASMALDVPVEVCSARPSRRQTIGGVASGAKTARSSSRPGLVRVVGSPVSTDSSVLLTPSQASSVSLMSGGGLRPLNSSMNRSLSLSFEQQAQAQAQALQQAHAQVHGQSLQMQAQGGSMQMLGMQPPQGQPFGPGAAAPMGPFGSSSLLLETPPLGTSGSVFGSYPGAGMLGPQSPQQSQLTSLGCFSPGPAQGPMSPLSPPLGLMSPSPCGGGLAPPMPLNTWPQR
mmetsp:Transcript_4992/g.14600  ORF Transcript_4992/g.14600 Transcript_4992/m.14600 type:complete len:670 (-) Transcript_4992:46-2055(-)